MVLKISLALLAGGLVMSTAGCADPMFRVYPTGSMHASESDARDCGASSFLYRGVAIDTLEIPEFSECMRSRGYSFGPP